MVIPESSFGLRCEAWHTGNSDGSCHAVLLSRREVHSIIENIAGFDTEHLRPLVLAEVCQGRTRGTDSSDARLRSCTPIPIHPTARPAAPRTRSVWPRRPCKSGRAAC